MDSNKVVERGGQILGIARDQYMHWMDVRDAGVVIDRLKPDTYRFADLVVATVIDYPASDLPIWKARRNKLAKMCQERASDSDPRKEIGRCFTMSIHVKFAGYVATMVDVGVSSSTIFSVFVGRWPATMQHARPNVPQDPADFARCHKLLRVAPEWRRDLKKVSDTFPAWTALVENWSELEVLYEIESAGGKARALYDRMQELIEMSKAPKAVT